MNNLEQKNSGFTLIEIIAVLVILGILVSISVSTLFRQIERNRGQQAYHILDGIRKALEICGQENQYLFATSCNDWCADLTQPDSTLLAIVDPSDAYFTYKFPPGTGIDSSGATNTGGYTITATRRVEGIDSVTDIITITKDSITGAVSCVSGGIYQGIC